MKSILVLLSAAMISVWGSISAADTCGDIKKLEGQQKEHYGRMETQRKQLEAIEQRLNVSEWKFNRSENPHPRYQNHKMRMD